MSSIPTVLTTKEVAAASLRGINRVKNAANTGALKSLPRVPGAPHRFLETDVRDWILLGSPEF